MQICKNRRPHQNTNVPYAPLMFSKNRQPADSVRRAARTEYARMNA